VYCRSAKVMYSSSAGRAPARRCQTVATAHEQGAGDLLGFAPTRIIASLAHHSKAGKTIIPISVIL
jgi:hypothetical protein